MSAEALLENPALFSGKKNSEIDLDLIAEELVKMFEKFDYDYRNAKGHIFKMLYSGYKVKSNFIFI